MLKDSNVTPSGSGSVLPLLCSRVNQLCVYIYSFSLSDKKAFFSDQYKEIEENSRMGKTRDLFKKIRDAKGTFHAKMGTIKEKMVWTPEKQKILTGGKNTQNYTKKMLMTQIATMV